MAAHYFACSRPTNLGDIWFSQHHNMRQLKTMYSAKGLISATFILNIFSVQKILNKS